MKTNSRLSTASSIVIYFQSVRVISVQRSSVCHYWKHRAASDENSQGRKYKKYLRAVKAPMDRMTGLTDQLLAYAQDGNYHSKVRAIRRLVQDTLCLVQHTIDPLIGIETDLPAESLNVEVDIAHDFIRTVALSFPNKPKP